MRSSIQSSTEMARVKRSTSLSLVVDSRAGQAALEYILLLFVLVSIGMSVLYQFNSAFRSFATNYFGSYLTCLLETGELPSLGSQDGSGGECDSEFKPFDLAEGRPLREPGSFSPSSGPPNSSSVPTTNTTDGGSKPVTATGPKSNVEGASGAGKGEPPLDGSGGGAGDVVTSSTGSSIRGGGPRPPGSDAASGSVGGGKPVALNPTEEQAFSKSSQALDSESGRLRYIPSDQKTGEEDSLRNRTIAASTDDLRAQGRRVPADFNKKKKGADSDADVGLSLPDFFRYLIIAAIIIAILFFFGGQALQFSKSQEK